MKHYLTILLFTLFACKAPAQTPSFLSIKGQTQLLQIYQWPEADFLSLINEPEISSPEAEYLRLYGLFMAYQTNERKLYANSFHKGIKQFETSFERTPQVQLMHVTLLIQQSLLYWNKNESSDGASSFYKAHRIFRRLNKQYYADDYLKLDAIFNIFLSQIPEQFKFWASLIGLEGNLSHGFEQLHTYIHFTKKRKGHQQEALTLYSYCLLKFGNRGNKEIESLILLSEQNNSPLLNFVTGSLTIKNRMGRIGLDFINSLDTEQFTVFPLLEYLRGRLLLNQLNDGSYQSFQKFLSSYSGYSFRTDALMRQAWCLHINHQTSKRDSLISIVKTQEQLPTSNDQQAAKEVLNLTNKPEVLLRARLIYDGGYYRQANSLLSKTNSNSFNNYYLAEYHYRFGRIKQELNQYQTALKHYDKAIALTQNDERYIGPYSALEAAKIKLATNDTTAVMHYLKQAKQLNTGEYKRDISQQISSLIK